MELKEVTIKVDGKEVALKVQLRSEITGADWERWHRISAFYSRLSKDAEKNTEIILGQRNHFYNQQCNDIIVDENGNPLPFDYTLRISVKDSLTMVSAFFLEYLRLNNEIAQNLETLGTSAKQ